MHTYYEDYDEFKEDFLEIWLVVEKTIGEAYGYDDLIDCGQIAERFDFAWAPEDMTAANRLYSITFTFDIEELIFFQTFYVNANKEGIKVVEIQSGVENS